MTTSIPLRTIQRNDDLVEKTAFAALLLFLFLLFSRVIDFIRIPNTQLILSVLILGITAVTGRLFRGVSTTIGLLMAAFTVWLFICVPFSVWPGGSFHMITQGWLRSFLVFMMVSGIVITTSDCRKALQALAFASFVIAILASFMGGELQGRLVVGAGSLGNSNDLAQFLMVGLPFWFLTPAGRGMASRLMTLLRLVAVPLILVMVLRTGSRGALIGIAVMAIFFLFRMRSSVRIMAIAACLVIAPVLVLLTPQDVRARYMTMFDDESAGSRIDRNLASAIASKQQRLYLLKQSIRFTFTKPVFGVGPGQFSVASSAEAEAQGLDGAWLQTHNTFTQLSSETGLPGFFLYAMALFLACRNVRRIEARAKLDPRLQQVGRTATCLWMSLVGFLVTSLFSSIAYHPQVLVLIAICTVFGMAFDAEFATKPQQVPQRAGRLSDRLSPVRVGVPRLAMRSR